MLFAVCSCEIVSKEMGMSYVVQIYSDEILATQIFLIYVDIRNTKILNL